MRQEPCGAIVLSVAHAGFEPVISALRGRCPGPLDECARMAGDGGFEPPHTDPESAVLPLDESPAACHCSMALARAKPRGYAARYAAASVAVAARRRARQRSRPRISMLSNSGGVTLRPVTATRTSANRSPAFSVQPVRQRRAAPPPALRASTRRRARWRRDARIERSGRVTASTGERLPEQLVARVAQLVAVKKKSQ